MFAIKEAGTICNFLSPKYHFVTKFSYGYITNITMTTLKIQYVKSLFKSVTTVKQILIDRAICMCVC